MNYMNVFKLFLNTNITKKTAKSALTFGTRYDDNHVKI